MSWFLKQVPYQRRQEKFWKQKLHFLKSVQMVRGFFQAEIELKYRQFAIILMALLIVVGWMIPNS